METYQRMPTAVRDFLEQCFDSLDWGGGVWTMPPTVKDQNSLIKEINKIYRNKRTIGYFTQNSARKFLVAKKCPDCALFSSNDNSMTPVDHNFPPHG